jgi:hypothetical protein
LSITLYTAKVWFEPILLNAAQQTCCLEGRIVDLRCSLHD